MYERHAEIGRGANFPVKTISAAPGKANVHRWYREEKGRKTRAYETRVETCYSRKCFRDYLQVRSTPLQVAIRHASALRCADHPLFLEQPLPR